MSAYSTPNPTAVVDDGTAGGSMSAVFTETESGWHVLKIERYTQTKGVLGVGNAFTSTAFTAGGHRWRIGYYADGYADDTGDFVGLELFLDDPGLDDDDDSDEDTDVKARFVFSLLDGSGKPVPEYTAASEVGAFSGAVPSWGFESFIERAVLESAYLQDDDSFSVRCDVTVFRDSRRDNSKIVVDAATPPARQATTSRSCGRVAARFVFWVVLLAAIWVALGRRHVF